MPTPVCIPKLGVSMTEGSIVQWLVDDGAAVEAGDPLYVLESDKTETEIAAPASGVLKASGAVGETYAVGDQIGEILEPA